MRGGVRRRRSGPLFGGLALLFLAAPFGAAPLAAQDLDTARDALREGRYEEALDAYGRLAREAPAASPLHRERARALMELGRYEDAARAVSGASDGARSPELENVLGEALIRLGRRGEAEAAFRRSLDADASDRNVALANLGRLLWQRGEREGALEIFDSFIDLYNRTGGSLSAEELMAVGTAVRHLSVRDPDLFQDALRAYDEAAARAPADARPPLLAGELFLEAYNATDARASFDEVLARNPRHPRALLGRARVLDFAGEPGAMDAVRAALETNPDLVEARAFAARLHLKAGRHAEARSDVERALEVDPGHLEALSVLAATHYLLDETAAYRRVRDRVLDRNPTYTGLHATVAELAAETRRYQEAVDLAGAAARMDSTSARSLGILGMNQLRTGALEEGRRNLERAFRRDPYNVWYKNTLDLLDTFDRYETVRTEHFELFIHGREAELLAPYARELAEEAYDALRARYGAEPPTPIRVEIFPSHGDFSVRTLGLTGLGALGVSFGNTVVLDSPSAREPGEFNWAETLWHELAHSFHMAMTDQRVPRWFTEGLAVHETREARAGWGHTVSPGWLRAWSEGRLHPVSRLDEGFVRPRYPEEVAYSYYQASLVFQWIEARWGTEPGLRMMEGYRDGRTTEELVPEVLGMEMPEVDRAFEDWLRERFEARAEAVRPPPEPIDPTRMSVDELQRVALENPDRYQVRLALGRALLAEGRPDEAEAELQAAIRLFPEYAGPDGPYRLLARIHRERGEPAAAARALHQIGLRTRASHGVHAEEAELRTLLGEPEAAARALEKAVEVFPYDVELHARLADLHVSLRNHERAVRERRAVLALDPVDRADAHYRLAAALLGAGEREEARREVIRSLEIAPGFEEAQELLLLLRQGGPR